MAQNEMKAKPALPERVRSMEGLGAGMWHRDLASPNEPNAKCGTDPWGNAIWH